MASSSPSSSPQAVAFRVKSPPVKAKDVGGHLVPTVKGAFGLIIPGYERRVTLEVNVVERPSECVVAELPRELREDDRARLRIWKRKEKDDRDDDDSSDDDSAHSDSADTDGSWIEYREYDLDEIHDVERHKYSWEATLGRAALRERREFKFKSTVDTNAFDEAVRRLREASEERAARRLEGYRRRKEPEEKAKVEAPAEEAESSADVDAEDSDVELLVQIASASNLPVADVDGSADPYVSVYLGQKKMHGTKTIHNSLNPVYTIEHDNTFLLKCSAKEFFEATSGLTFVVKDTDKLDANDTIARADVKQDALLKMKGERTEIRLDVVGKLETKGGSPPALAIKVREAEPRDVRFVERLRAESKSETGIFSHVAFLAPQSEKVKLFQSETKKENGIKLYRTKPTYDPDRPKDETKWLNDEQLEKEMLKPSQKWIESGSGNLGKVYLEILKIEGLPDLDKGIGKTDAFACIMYEDAIVCTDVINDCLSPKFMPWTSRAFALNREHPSSQLHVGVMDYDGVGNHNRIGRITVDLTNFSANGEYLLKYVLYKSVLDDERPEAGRITVRIRVEDPADGFKGLVLGTLKPPLPYYINSNKESDFKTSYFVVNGEENLNKLDMEALKSYQQELMQYAHILPLIVHAVKTVLLWRGHYDLKVAGKKISLPLHSMTAFIMGIMVVENYNLIPAFSLFCIAWLLMATNEHRQHHPSPWHKTLTFSQMWLGVLTGKTPKVDIDANENEGAVRRHEETLARQKKEREEKAKKAQAQATKVSELTAAQDPASEGDVDDGTTKLGGGGLNLNPMSWILLPVQRILTTVCMALRVARSFIVWDESIYSFVLVNACLAGGLVLMIVPWGFFICWTLRIVVWVGLGPWMKFADIYYVQKLEEEGDNDAKKYHAQLKAQADAANQTKKAFMIAKETSKMNQAMKKYYFGKYMVATPQFKSFRYRDFPLMESQAHPVDAPMKVSVAERKYGQNLDSDMIPKWSGEEAAY